jgi:hypothetical protein
LAGTSCDAPEAMKQALFISAILLPTLCYGGQPADHSCEPWHFRPFENRNVLSPIVANPRATQIQLLAVDYSRRFEYSIVKKPHMIWDVNAGLHFPLLTVEQAPDDKPIHPGCWRSLSNFLLDFHVIEDLTDVSNPVNNTDYGFGFDERLVRALSSRDQIGVLIGLFHRSTHLGDEFVLNALGAYPGQFRRIDVNYQYIEASINWDRTFKAGTLTQRFTWLNAVDALSGHQGFYTTNVRGFGHIYPSVRNYEPSYGAQFMPSDNTGWRPYISYNVELSTVLNFSKHDSRQKESSQFSHSIVVGLRHTNHSRPFTPDPIIRAYYGVNPYGQFRKQNDYWQFALGFNIAE